MAQQHWTDKNGIVRDSTSIYWFGGTKCDIYETDRGMFAVVKETNTKPELWEYRYTSNCNKWEFVRGYKQEQTARIGMLRYEKRLEGTQN